MIDMVDNYKFSEENNKVGMVLIKEDHYHQVIIGIQLNIKNSQESKED